MIAQVSFDIPSMKTGLHHIVRIEFNNPIIVCYGTVKIAQIRLSAPPIKVGFYIVRVEFDRLVVVCHSAFNIASLQSLVTLLKVVLWRPIFSR